MAQHVAAGVAVGDREDVQGVHLVDVALQVRDRRSEGAEERRTVAVPTARMTRARAVRTAERSDAGAARRDGLAVACRGADLAVRRDPLVCVLGSIVSAPHGCAVCARTGLRCLRGRTARRCGGAVNRRGWYRTPLPRSPGRRRNPHVGVISTVMARSCAICGKVAISGWNPQSSGMNRVRAHRRYKPNLHPFDTQEKGKTVTVMACTRCRRTARKTA